MSKGNVVKICPKCDQIEVIGNVLVYQSLCDACWKELEKELKKKKAKEGRWDQISRKCPKCNTFMLKGEISGNWICTKCWHIEYHSTKEAQTKEK